MRLPLLLCSAAALTLAACGGGGSAHVATSAVPSVLTSSGATSAASSEPSAPAAAVSSSAAPGTSSAAPSVKTSATVAATRSSAPPPVAGQKVASGYTPTGTYVYDMSGSSSPGGAISGTANLLVDAPVGTTQHSEVTDGNQQDTNTTLEHRSDGLHLVDLTTKGPNGTIEFMPPDRPVFLPANVATGESWQFTTTSTDGTYTLVGTFKGGPRGTTTVGGVADPTMELDGVLTITATGIRIVDTTTIQADTTRDLQVVSHDATKGTAYGISFTADLTQTMRSLTPS